MPRSYRSIVLAVVGWINLVGAGQPPENPKGPENTIAANKIDDAANSVASAIREAAKPAEKDGGCTQGHDKRESDLCAQWKAADAARDAAEYGFWALFVSTVGTVLLVWTLWETRANARRELRAYVSVKVNGTSMTIIPGKGIAFAPDALTHNGGSTPAYDIVSFANVIALPPEAASRYLARSLPIEQKALSGGSVLHAGSDLPVEFKLKIMIPMNEIDEVLNGQRSLYIYGTTAYLDTFNVRRRTDFCFTLGPDRFRESYIATQVEMNQPIEVIWTIAAFHNTAT